MLTEQDKAEIMEMFKQATAEATKETLAEFGVGEAMEAVQALRDSQKLTKEDIMKVRSRKERQRLIRENIDLFK